MPTWLDDINLLAPARVIHEQRANGTEILRSPESLGPYERCVGEWVERWARETPGASAFAERRHDGHWRRLTWRDVRVLIGSIGQWLIDAELPPGKPVVILSENAIDHALLMLAALHVGRPTCSVSAAYSRSTEHAGVSAIVAALDPALVYAASGFTYGPSISACQLSCPVVLGGGVGEVPGAICFDRLLATSETSDVRRAFTEINGDADAKYLLTSGSTGHPKVVVNTHRMLCANQQMLAQVWRFLEREKPVLVDWLPWSHTFGGNHDLNLVLRNGGTLVVDEGRPSPGLVDATLRNLREVRPNLLFNVPRGFDMLLPALEADSELARDVLVPLRMAFYAGAALAPSTWRRLEEVSARVRTEPLWLTTSWGATETSPAVTSAHWRLEGAGSIGIPLPGVELKLVPNADKRELRVRGVNVFPGYRNQPHLTADAFDEEGYYRIGDAGYLEDPSRPEKGVVFDGRIAEDFKLGTGTWVSVGALRPALIAAFAPYAQDLVITGHDQNEIGLLLFPSVAALKLGDEELAEEIRQVLRNLSSQGRPSSQCPRAVVVCTSPPSAEHGEITDKGYLNQRAVLTRRSDLVALLADQPSHRLVIRAATAPRAGNVD